MNHIVDISDNSSGSPLLKLSPEPREIFMKKNKVPELCSKEIEPVEKIVQKMKTHNRGMNAVISTLKNVEKKKRRNANSLHYCQVYNQKALAPFALV